MPYSQTHLNAAWQFVDEPLIQERLPWLSEAENRAAFLFGSIAPDSRVISQQPRESTHFFSIPPQQDISGVDNFLNDNPDLADSDALSPAHASFVAGYMSHVIMDEVWLYDAVMPCLFIDGERWGPQHPNWDVYHLLMASLEFNAAEALNGGAGDALLSTHSDGWAPFIDDQYLNDWRQRIGERIRGTENGILHHLASSKNMSLADLQAMVSSADFMQEKAYCVVPETHIETFMNDTRQQMRDSILSYFSPADVASPSHADS